MHIDPPWLRTSSTVNVMGVFTQAGKKAYFVGGCVRNHLLGAPVSDFDISTDALPAETIKIAQDAGLKAVPTGIEHGTITVISGGEPFEVTTFRRDVETDGRRAVVAFSKDILDDARRRDFTMNALYADKDGHILDPLNGLPDIQCRQIRFIEDANQRIAEDYLRILRFFRFHAWYGDPDGGIDADGLAACADGIDGLDTLSKERIGAEMRKLLAAIDPAPALASMAHCGALMRVLPGANSAAIAPLVHLEQHAGITPSWPRRLMALGGENTTKNLRLSRAESRQLSTLKHLLGMSYSPAEAGYRHGKQPAIDGALVFAAGLSTPLPPDCLSEIDRGEAAIFPVAAKDLQPTYSGKALGEKLIELEDLWVQSDFQATKSELLD